MTAAAFEAMDDALFDAFGIEATVSRGNDPAVPVVIVVERGLQRTGEYGQAIGRVDAVSFRVREWSPKQNDTVTFAGQSRRIADIDADDGLVARAVLHG